MGRVTRGLRKLLIASVGLPLFVLGLILIPLPGPGLLVCLLALLILSREFDWASRRYDQVKRQFTALINETKEKRRKIMEQDKPDEQ